MPAPIMRGRLVPEDQFEQLQDRERQERIRRFAERAHTLSLGVAPGNSREPVNTLDSSYEERDFEPRFHDVHSVSAARAALAEAMNSRSM